MYALRLSLIRRSDEPELNGRILTVSGGTVSFDNVTTASAQVFVAGSTMTAADPKDMLVQIYVLSEIDNNQVLALDGAPGLQALVQTSAITNTAGPVIDAQSFLANPADSTITDNHAGSWIAMPKPTGGWHVYWYDGKSCYPRENDTT